MLTIIRFPKGFLAGILPENFNPGALSVQVKELPQKLADQPISWIQLHFYVEVQENSGHQEDFWAPHITPRAPLFRFHL